MAAFSFFASNGQLLRHLNIGYDKNAGLGRVRTQVRGFKRYRVRADVLRRYSEPMPENLAAVPADHVAQGGVELTPRQKKENADRARLRENLSWVGTRQQGRLSKTHPSIDFYPIKVWGADGGILPNVSDGTKLFFNDIEMIPITDEMSAYAGHAYPVRDDNEFQIFPVLAPLRGIKNNDYFRIKKQSSPPGADTTFDDGTANWGGYDFWRVTRIIDEPRDFMMFFILPISRIY